METDLRIVFLIALFWVASAAQSQQVSKAFDATNGFLMSGVNGDIVWFGGGDQDPTILPGVPAPVGSMYRRTNGQIYNKTLVADTGWTIQGLASDVTSQTTDLGRNGNAAAGSFLYRAGSVPSNVSGVPVLLTDATIRVVACSNEDIATYSIEFYTHEGDFINPILVYTLSVTSARGGGAVLNIPVTLGKQLAARAVSAVKNIGCTVQMKGLAI